jgi:glycosyltransferase involved in cell wall biosynthesis
LEGIIEGEKIVGVTLAGFRQIEDLPAYYALASAFIHPALQDQWGLVVNEAMACGLPVIVSKQSGCSPELVKDGVNGFVYDARDTQGLSKLMYRFCTGDYDLNSFGQASREIISLWGTDCFAEGLYSAITCALG